MGIGGLLRLGMIYRISNAINLTAGVHTLLISNAHKVDNAFKPIDAQNAFAADGGVKYNTLLNASKGSLTTQFGIFVGLHFKLNK
jgi:hypothetical protein